MKTITVLGIGNILLQDEGFGVRVAEELNRRFVFPANVQVLDGGTLGMDLLRFITGTKQLIIIDAIAGTSEPGTIYELTNDAVKPYFKDKVSMHELSIQDVLAVLEILGKPVKEIIIIGVEPASLDIGLDLTPVTAAAVDRVIDKIIGQLTAWQVEVRAKCQQAI